MSAAAVNPAPSPSPATGSSANPPTHGSSGSGAGAAGGAKAAQAQDPLAAFEALLSTLFGVKDPAVGAKLAANGKTATGDGKTGDKSADATGDKIAATDATAANPNLALLVPIVASLPASASTLATAEEGAAQPALANVSSATGKSAGTATGASAAAALAQLAGTAIDGEASATAGRETATAKAEPAADSVAVNASATAKVDATLTAKTQAAQVQAAAIAAPAPEAPPVVTAATTAPPPVAPVAEKPAEPAAPVVARDRVQAIKTSTRVDSVKAETTPGGIAALSAKAADPLQPVTQGARQGGADHGPAQQPLLETRTETGAPIQTPGDPATASTTAPAALIHAAAIAVRGAPQTVANLTAQIVKKLDGRSSRFDLQLDPVGLGKVDVRIAIGADGRMSAAMSFDTPQAAAELKARAGELQQAMAQAGFDLSGGISFDVASDRGQGQGSQAQNQQPETGAAFRGRAFQAALDNTADAGPPQYTLRHAALAGVDIRI